MEIFVDIKGYEGLYKISNLGNIYSFRSFDLLKPKDSHSYKYVTLCKDGKRKNKFIHRLVAEAFIPNTSNKPQVNHIDGNKSNNTVKNLEWATPKENCEHRNRVLKVGCRKVKCIETGKEFNSIKEAAAYYGKSAAVLNSVLRNYKYNHTFSGYHWKYML